MMEPSAADTNAKVTAIESGRKVLAIDHLAENLDAFLDELHGAKPFAKSRYQTEVFQVTETLMASAEGLAILAARAHRFHDAGVFHGGPWADVSKLQAPLVEGSLKGDGIYPVIETLSELRLLAIAEGRVEVESMSAADAREFLEEVMALNLEFVFPGDTEQERIEGGLHRDSNIRLFGLLAQRLGLASLRHDVVREIAQICAQRPIKTTRVRQLIEVAARIPKLEGDADGDTLELYLRAAHAPTQLCARHPDPTGYRQALEQSEDEVLRAEATSLAQSMWRTGLVAPHHAVLLRKLRVRDRGLLPEALGLNDLGVAEYRQNEDLTWRLMAAAVFPATAQSVYGLAGLLQRGYLSRPEVSAGLQRIVDLDLLEEVRKVLATQRSPKAGVSPNSVLLAGAIAMLGQPLGVGQGRNPTCQAARGLSLWAQHAPGYLLEIVVSAARDGVIEMPFEGAPIRSDQLWGKPPRPFDPDVDPVSLIVVPHLDRIYEMMMQRVTLRHEDGHKWVNPEFYGRWVARGFASVFYDLAQTTVAEYETFVRTFYATHHPDFDAGHHLMYPNPVGLCITNSHGDYLGPHAVSLQRVALDPEGGLRVYYFNPNNEGRQDWGHGVRPTVSGHGEREGESSLPFMEFVSRLYAFHYNPFEEGDPFAVPDEEVAGIEQAARTTWGRSFRWLG